MTVGGLDWSFSRSAILVPQSLCCASDCSNHCWGGNRPPPHLSSPHPLSNENSVIHADSITKISDTVYLLCYEAWKILSQIRQKETGPGWDQSPAALSKERQSQGRPSGRVFLVLPSFCYISVPNSCAPRERHRACWGVLPRMCPSHHFQPV